MPYELAGRQPPPFSAAFLERYTITGLLGQGGMGAVYRARQVALDRDVALKVLRSSESDDVARFVREGQLLAGLKSSEIVEV